MAAPVVPSLIVNELLNEQNYKDWNFRVKTYLQAKGLWSVVEDVTDPPQKGKYKREAWEKTNAEALHAIHLCCGNDAFQVITGEERAQKAWDALQNTYSSGETTAESTKQLEEQEDADETEKEVKEEAHADEGYEGFFDAAECSNWESVMDFIKKHPEAVKRTNPTDEDKAVLHYAVEDVRLDIVKQLLEFIKNEDDLDRLDIDEYTALDYCTMFLDKDETVAIAKCLVEKKKELGGDGLGNRFLLVEAFTGRPKLADYLFNVTEFQSDDPNAAQLISLGFRTTRFDIACKLIRQNPSWVIAKDLSENSPLNELACTSSAFFSGSRLKFWEKWIYRAISVKSSVKSEEGLGTLNMDNKGDPDVSSEANNGKGKPIPKPHAVSGDVHPEEDGKRKPTHVVTIVDDPTYGDGKDKKSGLIFSGSFKSFCQQLWNGNVSATFQGSIIQKICKVFGIGRIYEMKVNHVRVHEILKCMCQELTPEKMEDLDDKKTEFVEAAMFQAAERGLVEFLIEILKVNPDLAEIENKKGQNLFQVAVECRQAEVFNLIHGFNDYNKKAYMRKTDDDDNNMLHMMGIPSPFSQTDRIRGAALQMQNELQWFKDLERMASLEDLVAKNDTLDMTPREFFTKNHTELVKEGEKSMKDTATSCTVVGALMVTMMFAVAFTLPAPQENKDNITLLSRRAFKVFIIADGISLFTSTTSVVLFLGILTSRYAEDDFLKSLPQKMILGLLTLFLSVAAMVIVFASALFIILPSHTFIALPTTLVAGIPIATFIWMQFPFLVEIFYSTYIRRLFNKKKVLVKLNVGKVK